MNTTTAEKTKVTDYELLDHGVDHAQYFPGCGVAYTQFDYVQTGAGENFSEALNDALEMIAQTEDNINIQDLENRINQDFGFKSSDDWPTKPEANADTPEGEDSELYYYVSIRYNK